MKDEKRSRLWRRASPGMKSMVGSGAVVPPAANRWDSQSGGQRSDGLVPPTQMMAHARLTSAYRKSIMSLAAQEVLKIKQILPRVQFLCLVKRKSLLKDILFVCHDNKRGRKMRIFNINGVI